MNSKKNDKKDEFEILRKIEKKPNSSQRELSKELGYSLGKLNYCLKALQKKGLIKIKNFKKNEKKINYIYTLTPQGISVKAKLAINFMKRIMNEYDSLRPGEKIHEEMITSSDSYSTYDLGNCYSIIDQSNHTLANFYKKNKKFRKVPAGFTYNSFNNKDKLTVAELKTLIKKYLIS